LHVGQQQWHVIHPFRMYRWLLVHTASLPDCPNPVQI
jgi:hypothetical protein